MYKGKEVMDFHVPSSRNAVEFYKMGFVQNLEKKDLEEEITWMTLKI